MDVSGQEADLRSAAFRQKLVSQIEDAMRKAGVAHSKSSKDMESHVFLKAKTRDEYLSLVARLIIHFRDIHNKKSQASVSDPMNALQSLTGGRPAGAAGIGMPSRGPGQSLGSMGGLGAMGQPMPLSGQPPPGTSGMAPHGMAVVSTVHLSEEDVQSELDTKVLQITFPHILVVGYTWDIEKAHTDT
ncbi:mediator of RNA polymerase II transcription subunit 15-like [Sorex fumeus]|uniref:mediator of RNA polymerase II transcription subunit 15-like n=1 Tax=Sorex fumeus TaxID=62283 RepID=UPI0024AD28D9|nr:mediator of RNA polymerase II transcription subunit 15-like [Sorex fumeus]